MHIQDQFLGAYIIERLVRVRPCEDAAGRGAMSQALTWAKRPNSEAPEIGLERVKPPILVSGRNFL